MESAQNLLLGRIRQPRRKDSTQHALHPSSPSSSPPSRSASTHLFPPSPTPSHEATLHRARALKQIYNARLLTCLCSADPGFCNTNLQSKIYVYIYTS